MDGFVVVIVNTYEGKIKKIWHCNKTEMNSLIRVHSFHMKIGSYRYHFYHQKVLFERNARSILRVPLFCSNYGFAYLRFTAKKLCFVMHHLLISLHPHYLCIKMRNYAKCKQNVLRVPRFYQKEWKNVALLAREF